MRLHTSFRVGGPADTFVKPKNVADLKRVLILARSWGKPITVVGAGSNLLVRDGGIRGIVVRVGEGFGEVGFEGSGLHAGAGLKLPALVLWAATRGLAGLEFAAGIPGSVGGAVVTNAGAFGGSIADVIRAVTVVDPGGEEHAFPKEALGLVYRGSRFRSDKEFILTGARFELVPDRPDAVLRRLRTNQEARRFTQPVQTRSAGSIFKNPPGDYAGRLLDACGCKGLSVGGAQVSEVHANFIVNLGEASAGDVLRLIEELRSRVEERFGIHLELEVEVLGED